MKENILQKFGYKFRTEGISEKVKNIYPSAITSMLNVASQMEDVVFCFVAGIPPFSTAEFIRQDVCKLLADKNNIEIDQYALVGGVPALKKAFAQKLQKQKNVTLDAEKEILVTCGSIEALKISLDAIIEPGDEVILFSPGFSYYYAQVLLALGKSVYIPLIEEENWRMDISLIEKAITKKTKAILLTSPNNPTGNVLKKSDFEKIAQIAEAYNLFIISDEAYDFLTYDNIEHFSALNLPQFRSRFIVCLTCSKEYAMTGWRVGFACADEGIIHQLQKIHDATVLSVPTISQFAAISAIEGKHDYIEAQKNIYKKRRQIICERLDRLANIFEYNKPEGGYYVFPKIKNRQIDDVEFCLDVLKNAKVALVPGSDFGPSGKGHVRIVFIGAEDDLHKGFDRLEKYLT